MKHSLNELAEMARAGSGEAFAQIYSLYAADMYRFALSFMQDGDKACDCVQETVLICFENISKLKKTGSVKAWMFKILSNECKKRLADKRESPCENAAALSDLSAHEPDTAQLSAELKEALSSLGETERTVVLLSVIGGCTGSQIGEMLSMRPGSVRSMLSRSLKKLKKQLE